MKPPMLDCQNGGPQLNMLSRHSKSSNNSSSMPTNHRAFRLICGGGGSSMTKLEICLFVLCALLFAALVTLVILWLVIFDGYKSIITQGPATDNQYRPLLPYAVNDSDLWQHGSPLFSAISRKQHNDQGAVCTSQECALIAGLFVSNLNTKVDPCEDFYEYACGNYEMNHQLPSNKPFRHTISDVSSRVNKQVQTILETPITPDDKQWDRLAKGYYKKCLDEDELVKNGLQTLISILDDIGGWPVLHGQSWKPWEHSWEKQLAIIMNRTGINAIIIEFAVAHDPKNSSRTVIELDQPKWGAGNRWPYLNGPDDLMIQNYTQLMIQIAVGLGADPVTAAKDMREAVELEVKLVNFSADEQMRRDADRAYNPFALEQLVDLFPYIDFETYIKVIFDQSVEIDPNDTVIIREMEYFRGIQHIMRTTSKRVLSNYIMWRAVQGFAPFLPPTLREPFYTFRANQTGVFYTAPPERWEDCVTLSVMMLDMPVGKLFVQHFFETEKAMKKMADLTFFLKKSFINQLHTMEWMDEQTRKRAIEKANYIEYKSGYPLWLFNDTWMMDNWGYPEPTNDEQLIKLTIRLKLSRVADELMRLKLPVDKSTWYQSPAQVDAYYAPNLNEMIFPAGIMQFPFLTPGVPNYITFAMAGAVVGHEVSHAFDDQGGRYDELGNLFDWWKRETAVKFYEKTECFVRQYESILVKEAGVHLNGRLSLGENIADNGGVKTAYAAYNEWLRTSKMNELALPGLQNYTNDQLFFLAYANNWCSIVRPKFYVQLIMTDFHSPGKYRAMVPLKNREEFSRAYNCPLGSPMNPVEKCAVW